MRRHYLRSNSRLASSPTSTHPSYWVIKGRPSLNDFEKVLKPGGYETWRTARPPATWSKGDRLFFWRSGPALDVIGLGEFLSVRPRKGKAGESLFDVRYLTEPFRNPLGIDQLRSAPFIRDASFLKAGPAGTVFPLTTDQGRRLYKLVYRYNSPAAGVWPDLGPGNFAETMPPDLDLLDLSGREGARHLVTHLRLERDRRLVEKKKRAVLRVQGKLACEVCGFDFGAHYGPLGTGFCEVHHCKILSKTEGERVTRLKDLAIVCSNCHRMLHRGDSVVSIARLRRIRRSQKRTLA